MWNRCKVCYIVITTNSHGGLLKGNIIKGKVESRGRAPTALGVFSRHRKRGGAVAIHRQPQKEDTYTLYRVRVRVLHIVLIPYVLGIET